MNIRPVRLAPWAAGARPTIASRARRVAEAGDRPRPVVLAAVAPRRVGRRLLAPLDQPRAAPAGVDLRLEGQPSRFHRHTTAFRLGYRASHGPGHPRSPPRRRSSLAAGCGKPGHGAETDSEKGADVGVLNAALGQELTALDAYTAGHAADQGAVRPRGSAAFAPRSRNTSSAIAKAIRGLGGEADRRRPPKSNSTNCTTQARRARPSPTNSRAPRSPPTSKRRPRLSRAAPRTARRLARRRPRPAPGRPPAGPRRRRSPNPSRGLRRRRSPAPGGETPPGKE